MKTFLGHKLCLEICENKLFILRIEYLQQFFCWFRLGFSKCFSNVSIKIILVLRGSLKILHQSYLINIL